MSAISATNQRQQEAIRHVSGPLLVLAGAGSGKTSVITRKIAWLIEKQDIPARHVAAVTFTNKAAREMKERVQQLVPRQKTRGLIISTFHSLGMRIIRQELSGCGLRSGFSILDQADSRELLKGILLKGDSEQDVEAAEQIQAQISAWKNAMTTPEMALSGADTAWEQRVAVAFEKYNRMLRVCNTVDLDDLLYLPVQLFREQPLILAKWRRRIHYLLVDEYQDTNSVQYELVRLLTLPEGHFTVVGDDDQSIYTWRGARPENLAQLQQDWPALEIVKLEQNYRSSRRILKVANAVIANNPHVFEKQLWSEFGYGDPIRICALRDEGGETEWIAHDIFHQKHQSGKQWKDFAVLYRGNFQSRLLELKLKELQIPYKVSGGTSLFAKTEIKDLMCYLRLLVNPDDDNAFLRIINTPRRDIGPATLEKLANWAARREKGLYHVCGDLGLREMMPARAADNLMGFKHWLDGKREFCFRENSSRAIRELITDIDYEGWLMQNASTPRVGEKRVENIWQLVASIERMLERQETDGDDQANDLEAVIRKLVLVDMLARQEEEDDSDRVQLMTLHAAKGLEFPHVYLMGVEENLLPHSTSIEEDNIVEERRLLYVGVTRAKQKLTLTHALSRKRYGEKLDVAPSRFISELPEEELEYLGEGVEKDEARNKAAAEAGLANLRALLEN